MQETNYYMNVNGRLLDLSTPQVMGILNVTPDSFYAGSRMQTETQIATRVEQMLEEGADMIDIGAYSSRPGAADISVQEEMDRLRAGLRIVRRMHPDAIVSVDTFRAAVACMCVEEYGVAIVNDISGGEMDKDMFPTVARLGVPYVLMHMRGTPATMQQQTRYGNVTAEVIRFLAERLHRLYELGVHDVLVDPGFGFAKTLEQNYRLLRDLPHFALLEASLLVGVSRKRMVYQLLDTDPQHALNGTTAVHMMALAGGASVLRVHDVKEAVEAVKVWRAVKGDWSFARD